MSVRHPAVVVSMLVLMCFAISKPLMADDSCPGGVLPAGTGDDLVISTGCTVNGNVTDGKYSYGNVNIIAPGSLTFVEPQNSSKKTEFWAKGILVENGGALTAGSPGTPIGMSGGVVTIHLYGADQGTSGGVGIPCVSDQKGQCGIPDAIWSPNGSKKVCIGGKDPNDPDCPDGIWDYFYQYMPIDYDTGNPQAYFGYKVLGVSYGGTLRLYGAKGVDYSLDFSKPWYSGQSWARLNKPVSGAKDEVVLDREVNWRKGDEVVLTTTDYLPGHSEQLTIADDLQEAVSQFHVKESIQYPHNGQVYVLKDHKVPAGIGPDPDPNLDPSKDPQKRYVETRAAVGLLSRSIRIVSGGDELGEDFKPESTHYFFGGHTMFRQGFKQVQIQGVEFKQLGQGGRIMHYPVHFHMARKVPADTFIADSSINESMTRWITIHATQGVTIARNVGWKSIGHGFYLEDGTETDNKFFANLGVFARAAVMAADSSKEKYNPRQVPGILAARYPAWNDAIVPQEYVPYHTDMDHPSVFWIMNGWNDFQYNQASGAGTCGVCYWLVPGAISTMSRSEKWEGYAGEQNGLERAAMTPLKSFEGNSCSSAMMSFHVVSKTSPCFGVVNVNPDAKIPTLVPIDNPLAPDPPPPPPPPPPDTEAEQAHAEETQPMEGMGYGRTAADYYPILDSVGNRFPTLCPAGKDCTSSVDVPKCASEQKGNGADKNCVPTILNHFTSSFSWAELNVSSVWLRPLWYLYINSALTDAQNGGATFVTGGGYTDSDVIYGHWALAKKDVFIGNTQPNTSQYASNAGAVTPSSGLHCARRADNSPAGLDCLVRDQNDKEETVALQLSNFSVNQRLFNIYDGPAYEANSAYLDITATPLTDCKAGIGPCYDSKFSAGWTVGIPIDKDKKCYLPNAAIGWKQPNGFYYPPAFHSQNLFFNNVDIRHFVIEPLLRPNTYFSWEDRVKDRYCTYTPGDLGLFYGYTDIDRQTELNDDDGTLTGLRSSNVPLKAGTISVNEDPFFNTPLETGECRSDVATAPDPGSTAKTSPYDFVTTAIFPDCGKGCLANKIFWWHEDCSTQACAGVPLYREFVKQDELNAESKPYIRMAGQGTGQRSTLTQNNGSFYLDTTTTAEDQAKFGSHPSLFRANDKFYMYFLFAKSSTTQRYAIYVGPGFDMNSFKAVRMHQTSNNVKKAYSFDDTSLPSTWAFSYNDNKPNHIKDVLYVDIDMNFTDFQNAYNTSKQNRCKPQSFCSKNGNSCGCSLNASDPLYNDCVDVCANWANRDVDCPEGGCWGFRFNMGSGFTTGQKPNLPPTPGCYDTSSSGPWNLQFTRHDQSGQDCYYETVPQIEKCMQK